MPGDSAKALRQPISVGPIEGYTPLHVLCQGSDACLAQDKIVGLLLDNGIVPVKAFSWGHQSASGLSVIVFSIFSQTFETGCGFFISSRVVL